MAVEITIVPVTMFVQNCMVLDPGDGRVIIVDPGGELPRITDAIGGREVAGILVTHGHIDHIGALPQLAERTGAPVWFHPDDRFLFERPGMGSGPIPVPDGATEIADGDTLEVGPLSFEVLHTPGHSPGHVCFLFEADEGPVLIGGDLLFAGSIGRTDLPGGDIRTLVRSVETKVWTLPDDTRVLPGHGPETTVEREKAMNPFVGLSVIGDLR